jgi:CBS domain-containing protein
MDVLNSLLENFATNTSDSKTKIRGNSISDSVFYTDQQSEMQFFQSLSYNTTPLTTTIDGCKM